MAEEEKNEPGENIEELKKEIEEKQETINKQSETM